MTGKRHECCLAQGMANELKDLIESTGRAVAGAVGTAAGVAAGAAAALTRSKEPRKVDPVIEESHWREHFTAEPYYDATYAFEDYLPAWRTGWEGIGKYPGKSFEQAERDLQADFHWNRGQSRLLWEQARDAVRAGFERQP
jgi:hypothetical protein